MVSLCTPETETAGNVLYPQIDTVNCSFWKPRNSFVLFVDRFTGGYSYANSRTFRHMRSNIARVSRPVWVFCRLG
jgi:hypothetical protein